MKKKEFQNFPGRYTLNTIHFSRGMTLVDVIVGTAIMLMVFLSLFAAFQLSITLVHNTKAKAGAMAILTAQMESVRTLPYNEVGTVGGIPSGNIPQLQQKTLNAISYTYRTLIQYVDAPEDGIGAADTNGITADYKSLKVEVQWNIRGQSRSTFAVSRISPHGIESLSNGGTLRVNIFDALAVPVPDALVRIQNSLTSPAIDISVYTDDGGSVTFPGAPAAAGYRVTATKNGYSSAQTYDATATNPSPSPGHVAVANQQTTTFSLSIDTVASLQVTTYSPPGPGTFDDPFQDDTFLLSTSSAVVSNNALTLDAVEGAYVASGSAISKSISPGYLASWTSASWVASSTGPVSVLVHLYYWDGAQSTLVPDSALPGNSTGYSSTPVDLSLLSSSLYPSLQLGASLRTEDVSITPEILDWHVAYTAGPVPLPGVLFRTHGTKIIGSSPTGVPLYKIDTTQTTNQNGQWLFDPIEWDFYSLLFIGSGFDIIDQCPSEVSISPAEHKIVGVTVVPHTPNSVRTYVVGGGQPISGATVSIVGNSVNDSQVTSPCGQTFKGSLSAGTYTITVSAPGYQSHGEDVSVNGVSQFVVVMNPN